MHDDPQRLRQLKAAMRWRTLLQERAKLQWQVALQQLALAVTLWQAEMVRYQDIVRQQQQLMAHGIALNPAMQAQRISALSAARAMLIARQCSVDDARTRVQASKATWMKARGHADAAGKARQRVAMALAQHQQAEALTDIMDAQYRQGGCYGV